MPIQSETEQNPASLMSTSSRIISVGVSFADSGAWSHRTSKSWSSSFCKRRVTKRTDLELLHKLRLHENAHRSSKQFASLVRIGRIFEHGALRHLLFFGSAYACRTASSMQTQSSHRACRSREICSPHNRSRCHKFVNWLCYFDFFYPLHCELRIACFRTHFSLEVDGQALNIHRVWEFPQMHSRERKPSGNPTYHCEKKFH